MKIAYLIIAHNTPNHLGRLVRALDRSDAAFFIHIDQKSDLSEFRNQLLDRHITLLKDRVAVYWGDFSDVEATIRLIKETLGCCPSVNYLALLSGSDYLLRSPQYIENFFLRNNGRQFINLVPVPCVQVGKPLDRFQRFWFKTPYDNQFIVRVVARLNDLNRQLNLINRDYKKVFKGLEPFGGSQWWALTADACRHILEFIDRRPDVLKYFKNVYLPDESFFHTIIGNSEFAKNVTRNLTFTDWSRPEGGPALIDMNHLRSFAKMDTIIADDFYGRGELLFARKFPDDSSQLTDFIDTQMINRRDQEATVKDSVQSWL
jgi:hypothetical protein